MNLSQSDLAIDLPKLLEETEEAITLLRVQAIQVPDEAHQIASILRRAIAAEKRVAELEDEIGAMNE